MVTQQQYLQELVERHQAIARCQEQGERAQLIRDYSRRQQPLWKILDRCIKGTNLDEGVLLKSDLFGGQFDTTEQHFLRESFWPTGIPATSGSGNQVDSGNQMVYVDLTNGTLQNLDLTNLRSCGKARDQEVARLCRRGSSLYSSLEPLLVLEGLTLDLVPEIDDPEYQVDRSGSVYHQPCGSEIRNNYNGFSNTLGRYFPYRRRLQGLGLLHSVQERLERARYKH